VMQSTKLRDKSEKQRKKRKKTIFTKICFIPKVY